MKPPASIFPAKAAFGYIDILKGKERITALHGMTN
jgi:hypothetical protein